MFFMKVKKTCILCFFLFAQINVYNIYGLWLKDMAESPREDVGIVGSLESAFKLVQLVAGECRSVSSLFGSLKLSRIISC